jgi:hypothetical protein
MIVQITLTRDELFLIQEMMPQWQKYSDAFVFMVDSCTDGTYEFLMDNAKKYNILSVLHSNNNRDDITTNIESEIRQRLYDEALKHSGNIVCLDTDEYFDGNLSKEDLENIMNSYKDTLFHSRWMQYTDVNRVRVDGPWRMDYKDRIGSYSSRAVFKNLQMHSEHLPVPGKQGRLEVPNIFISHLQWLCKDTVALKQYYWKICDYVNRVRFGIDTIPASEYDVSVNNFMWNYSHFDFPLKVNPKIYDKHDRKNSFKAKFIRESIEKYNIPNLNDWGMGIHDGTYFKSY